MIATSRPVYTTVLAGVDWITATATAQPAKDLLAAAGRAQIEREEGKGNCRRFSRFRNCVGYTAGQASVWASPDLVVAQLTGSGAYLHWPSLLVTGSNCSRLDLQVTVGAVPADHNLVREAWQILEATGGSQSPVRHRSLYTTRPAGDTLYLGSRQSHTLLRLYDKHAESKGTYPPGTWRYEVQARSRVAGRLAADLRLAGEPERAVVGHVYNRFARCGVRPAFSRSGADLCGQVPRVRTDAERTRRWLRLQVEPALRRLLLRDRATGEIDPACAHLLDALERYLRCED